MPPKVLMSAWTEKVVYSASAACVAMIFTFLSRASRRISRCVPCRSKACVFFSMTRERARMG